MLDLHTLEGLRAAGFEQPHPTSKPFAAPTIRGVYLILTAAPGNPRFLKVGTGGHFKQRDPNVSLEELEAKWVPDALVLYVGKAGTALRNWLDQYLKFGAGKPIGHHGGRYIWQIHGSERLRVCWRTTPDDEPREVEKALIKAFRDQYGRLPFANLRS